MAHFKENVQTTNDYFIHKYEGTDTATLLKNIEETLSANGYKLVEGGGTNAVYEKGNRTMRILFGAFVKYYKFMVQLQEADSSLDLRITKHSSGMSGGLIGVSQVKKELARLGELMKDI